MQQYQAQLSLLARLLMAAGFLLFGYTKLFVFGPAGTIAFLSSTYHPPMPEVSSWISIILEVLGGLAIALGFQTRWVAAILALWCLFTGFVFHLPMGVAGLSDVYKNMVMAGGFVALMAFGPGEWSLDGKNG